MSLNTKKISKEVSAASYSNYITGFILSLILSLLSYLLISRHQLSGDAALYAVATLAVTQLVVQLYFFLHLGKESKPQWNMLVFMFMLIVVVVLVFGSLWIMKNLNYNTMSAHDSDAKIIKDEAIKR